MRTIATAGLIVVISSVILAAQQPHDKIPVFVKGATNSEGFTDPSKDRVDSVNDITKRLKDSDWVRVVPTEADALAIVQVLDRETKRETNMWGRQNKSYLTVRLTAAEYATEFTGESGSKGILKGYGAAAAKIVDQLNDWVKANYDKLIALKK